jgi:sugar phosphate isomerase/epimerase
LIFPAQLGLKAATLAHVHVNDPNLLGLGVGEIDCEPMIAAMRTAGYDGWLSVEVFDLQYGAERITTASVEYLQKLIACRSISQTTRPVDQTLVPER